MITAVLAGNPNCGKTTLFNRLTNSRYKVGNRIGVTVAPKIGKWNGNILVDLPGIYSLENSSAEETAAERYIKENEVSEIINIVDASNLERSLWLTFQLAQLKIPMIIVLNMADKIKESGYEINTEALAEKTGCPVVCVCAAKGEGIKELCDAEPKIPHADAVFDEWIEEFQDDVLVKCGNNVLLERSMHADRVLLGKFRFLILLIVMGAVFWLTFGMPGNFISEKLMLLYDRFGAFVRYILEICGVNEFLKRLICDGILRAVGSIVPFFGQILILFFCLSLLEDVGYMSRIIFIAEQAMEKIGLCGRSIVPIITGLGCTVPAAMTLKNISDERKRKRTANILPFISCSAKMPVYIVFASVVFNKAAPLAIAALYILGLLAAAVFSLSKKNREEELFVLELPPYRCPTLRNTMNELAEKLGDFAARAGSILFLAGIAVWFLESFDFSLRFTDNPSESILGVTGSFAAPIFIPCGFGNWQSAVALVSGLAAKEAIISTLSVVYGGMDFAASFSPASCCSFLTFVLFYTPCAAALSALGEELSGKELAALALRQFAAAWCVSVVVYIAAGFIFALQVTI